MPETRLHRLDVEAVGDEQTGEVVAQIMEPKPVGRPGTEARASRTARSMAHGPAGRPISLATIVAAPPEATAVDSSSDSSSGIGIGVLLISDFSGAAATGSPVTRCRA